MAALVGAVAGLLGGFVLVRPASAATTLIYATFKGDAAADEELWIYQSTNGGTSYSTLYDTNFRGPTWVLRDPSIVKRGSTYFVAYTWQSWTTDSHHFAVARSTDLKSWTNIATVASGISSTKFTWAPEFYIEGSTVRIIVNILDGRLVGARRWAPSRSLAAAERQLYSASGRGVWDLDSIARTESD